MGFFSWKTADKKSEIMNRYCKKPTENVYLLQPGGEKPILEPSYEGYGMFGGVDAYAWLARANKDLLNLNPEVDQDDDDIMRGYGIDLFFDRKAKLQYPLKFSLNEDAVYEELPASEDSDCQGYDWGGATY